MNANFSRKCDTPLRYFPSNRGPAEIITKRIQIEFIVLNRIHAYLQQCKNHRRVFPMQSVKTINRLYLLQTYRQHKLEGHYPVSSHEFHIDWIQVEHILLILILMEISKERENCKPMILMNLVPNLSMKIWHYWKNFLCDAI